MEKPNSDLEIKTEGWKQINWAKAERYVFKLQKRIYAASRRGDVKQCRKLQKTLMRSWSNRVIAVRRVTVENQGKKTAGVDGVKSLSPEARMELVGELKLTGKSKPTRRVWIPKPGRDEKRPLGIPTVCPYCTSILESLGIFCLTPLLVYGKALVGKSTLASKRKKMRLC